MNFCKNISFAIAMLLVTHEKPSAQAAWEKKYDYLFHGVDWTYDKDSTCASTN